MRRSHWSYRAARQGQLLVCFCLLVTGLISAQTLTAQELGTVPSTVDELATALTDILDTTNTPGMIVSVVEGDKSSWTGAFGIADRASNTPVTPDSRFRIGSITKTFTSLTALVLVEQGLVDLEIPLHDLIPEVGIENRWRSSDPVRLYHALEHTAGFDDIHLHEYAYSSPDITLLEGIRLNTTSRIARWRPGTRMAYSNIGPAIAALAMEAITSERFEELAQRHILDVVNMPNTSYFHHPNVVTSYRKNGRTPEPYIHIADRPSGSMNSTAGDMAKLLRMFLARGHAGDRVLISEPLLERMERPSGTLAAKAGLIAGYGLSNAGNEFNRFWYQGHSGGIDGFRSNFAYAPAINRGFFFSINASSAEAVRRINILLRAFLTQDLATPPQTPYLSGVNLRPISGYYQPDAPRQEIVRWLEVLTGTVQVAAIDDSLTITPMLGRRSVWRPLNERLFRREEGLAPTLAFVTSIDGEELLQGPDVGTLRKIPAWLAWARLSTAAACIALIASALLYAMWWLPLKLIRPEKVSQPRIRAWPASASLAIVVALAALETGQAEAIHRLGTITPFSFSFWFFSWLYAGLTCGSVLILARSRALRHSVGFITWRHSTLVAAANCIVLVYLASHGIIGLRTWAY